MWYFINILLFQVQKLLNCFSKYVWKLVAHFCVNSCFYSWYENIFEISGWTDTNNESNKNTNVKSDINKQSTNKRCQFLENIVPINEISEQNSNAYCYVDIVFALDPTNASFICGIKVVFSILNLYLFLKCITFDLKSFSSLLFDMRTICYLLCNNMHSYRSGKWHRKSKQ